MKSTLIYSTSKPNDDRRNALTIERLKRKKQREILKKYSNASLDSNNKNQNNNNQLIKILSKPIQNILKANHIESLNDAMFYPLNCDTIEEERLNILQNSLLPIDQLFGNTVQTYLNELPNSAKSIGWLIADYVLKLNK